MRAGKAAGQWQGLGASGAIRALWACSERARRVLDELPCRPRVI
jgi:hypothetical protein